MKRNTFLMIMLVVLPMSICQDEYDNPEESLRARKFNQTCEHEEQCADFRMTCKLEEFTNENRCLCVKYYTWDIYTKQCLAPSDMTEMMSLLIEQYDAQAEVEEVQKIFSGMLVAGIMVLAIGILMAVVCTLIACYRPSSEKDMWKCNHPSHQRRASTQARHSRAGSQRTVSPRRDGTGVDYVPGMFDVAAI